jgi:stage III sporulation protein SpoIIIAA
MVPRRDQQADILVQAVQNHNPDVIIVDEIGTKQVHKGAAERLRMLSFRSAVALVVAKKAPTTCSILVMQRRTRH